MTHYLIATGLAVCCWIGMLFIAASQMATAESIRAVYVSLHGGF